MDQTFDFRAAPVPLRRRVRPRAIALVVAGSVALSGLVSFSRLVIESERRSMERAELAGAATSIVGTISGSDDEPTDRAPRRWRSTPPPDLTPWRPSRLPAGWRRGGARSSMPDRDGSARS